jgi:hypothetical protein
MSISGVSSALPQFQALAAVQAQQPKDGAEPPAAKALEGVGDKLNATLTAVASGVDISV